MIDSPAMKADAPSAIVLLMKDHRIRLVAKYGRNSSLEVPKINPNTSPIAVICTAMPIVTQKGPIADLL
jgi:hypothetical protein